MRLTRSPVRIFATLCLLLLAGCGPDVMDDYGDSRFELTDQNGEAVIFPDSFAGEPLLMGFIYTNCPDVCPIITANMSRIHDELGPETSLQFVLVTFDPARDTPQVLKTYAGAFGLDHPPFRFLTGSEDEIESMMDRLGVRSMVSFRQETEDGTAYFLSHSDKMLLINDRGRLIMDYGGSMTPPAIVLEDLNAL